MRKTRKVIVILVLMVTISMVSSMLVSNAREAIDPNTFNPNAMENSVGGMNRSNQNIVLGNGFSPGGMSRDIERGQESMPNVGADVTTGIQAIGIIAIVGMIIVVVLVILIVIHVVKNKKENKQ
ncbi:MAG: hypothetical protein FWC79_02965 [Oscillospiraceae bacterium]|nr:hypothetical protein [Oscillospiraceae bacterium]